MPELLAADSGPATTDDADNENKDPSIPAQLQPPVMDKVGALHAQNTPTESEDAGVGTVSSVEPRRLLSSKLSTALDPLLDRKGFIANRSVLQLFLCSARRPVCCCCCCVT